MKTLVFDLDETLIHCFDEKDLKYKLVIETAGPR